VSTNKRALFLISLLRGLPLFPTLKDKNKSVPFSPSKREIGLFILSFGLIEMEKSKT